MIEIFDHCRACKRFSQLSTDKLCLECKTLAEAKSDPLSAVKRYGRTINQELNEESIIVWDHLVGDDG